MKRWLAHFVLFSFLVFTMPACDTQKPADEVKDAQDRVEQKVKDAREQQNTENPEKQEESN